MRNIKSQKLIIRTPSKIIFSGLVHSVSSENSYGRFDILPEHQKFISLISKEIRITKVNEKRIRLKIDKGILKCDKNTVEIYLNWNDFEYLD